MPEKSHLPLHRTERALLGAVITLVAVSLSALATTTIAAIVGNEMSGTLWPTLIGIGYFGLPLGFICAVVSLIWHIRHRAKQ